MISGHAAPDGELARPHPAFITDGGPTLLLENEGQIMTRRWAAVKMIASIGAIIVAAEAITAGLAANAASQVDSTAYSTPTSLDPQAIFTVAFAGFVEIALFAVASLCFLFCNLHFAYFLVVAFVGLSATGTGAYGLAVMAVNMSNSVCGDEGSCKEALEKGLAAACLRILLTAPFCLSLASWYFFKARRDIKTDRKNLRRQEQRPYAGVDREPLCVSREE